MAKGWFWQPDLEWLNQVNTTNLRTLNAIRGFVMTGVVWALVTLAAMWQAIYRCGRETDRWLTLGMEPATAAGLRRACEESIATNRIFDFIAGMFDTWSILLFGMAGVAAGAAIGKRLTDTTHRVKVEEAKKGPAPVTVIQTQEHTAPKAQVNVTVGETEEGEVK